MSIKSPEPCRFNTKRHAHAFLKSRGVFKRWGICDDEREKEFADYIFIAREPKDSLEKDALRYLSNEVGFGPTLDGKRIYIIRG